MQELNVKSQRGAPWHLCKNGTRGDSPVRLP